MEIIYSDIPIDSDLVKKSLVSLFPGLTPFNWNPSSGSPSPEKFDESNTTHILFNVVSDNSAIEFGSELSIYRTPDDNTEAREIAIIKQLLKVVNTRFMISYTHKLELQDPYFSLIFENGYTYLANDSHSELYDGDIGNRIRKLEKINLPVSHFDEYGNILLDSI